MFQGIFSPGHLLIVLVIVILVFGPSKLPELGSSIGRSLREFKKSMQPDEATQQRSETETKDKP